MKSVCLFLLTILLTVVPGCDRKNTVSYSGFTNIGPDGMPEDWNYEFTPTASDSADLISLPHDAVIIVRYTGKCKSKSIILNLEEISLIHDNPDSLTVEIPLFNDKGQPLGRGTYGIYEIADTIHRNWKVPDGYVLSVSSPLKSSSTVGINALGLVITRNSKL